METHRTNTKLGNKMRKMNTRLIFSICTIFVCVGINAATLEELANEVSFMKKEVRAPNMSTDVASSPLSQFAYKEGINVSTFSDAEIEHLTNSRDHIPSGIFCGEDHDHRNDFDDPLGLYLSQLDF